LPCAANIISTNPSAAALLISKIKIAKIFQALARNAIFVPDDVLFPRNLMF
jgi:hypothetical protein